jgi:hypothetical protein
VSEEIDLLAVLKTKSCSGCTKCCEGYLSANIKGHIMGPGKPCPFVIKDVGCGDYANRPADPCISFECEWRRNPYFEEWLAPKISGVIFTRQVLRPQNIPYLKITEAGSTITPKILTWAIKYAEKNNLNLTWGEDSEVKFVGANEFCEAMSRMN